MLVGSGVGGSVGVFVGVAVCVRVGVDVNVGVGVAVGVRVAVSVGVGVAEIVAVGNAATGVAVGAGPHAVNNKILKHTTTLLLESKSFIFFRSFSARHISPNFLTKCFG